MSNGVNHVHLIGNLGNDVELKYTQGGQAVARFSVATTESWKGRDGNKKEETSWHRVVAFGRLGEICGEFLAKGSKVYVQGRLKYGKYTGQDGVERYTTDILANEMRMLDSRREGEQSQRGGTSGSRGGAPQQKQRPAAATGNDLGADFADDDIPFVTNRTLF